MKKWLVIGLTLLVVAFGASYVFAATPETPAPGNGSFNAEQMIDACKQVVNNLVKEGTLTPDQGKAMNEMMKDKMGNNSNMMGQGTAQGTPCHDNGKTK
ncbi:hypothetical protein SCACP_28270 [Sporomusa carbonis]|uniref:DUF2680 domain-containing protein n=1 Tax=Sporomusa carbonis TaxID=3076075 RepID=UPI003A63CC90